MSEREATLARASWGAVMLYAVLFEIQRMPDIDQLPENWRLWASIVLAVWGAAWLLIGCGVRSRGDRNGRLISRYLVKIGLGAALLYYRDNLVGEFYWIEDWVNARSMLEEPARLLATWCLITGGMKLALVLRGFPPLPPVDPGMPHGEAKFSNPNAPGWKL